MKVLVAVGLLVMAGVAGAEGDPSLVASATEYAKLPVYREKGGGWLRGYRPSKIVAMECSASNALLTNSVKIVGADGRALRHGVDFTIEPTWGTVGLLENAAARTNEMVTMSYDYRLLRIDSVVRSNGKEKVRYGVPHVYMPKPPALAADDELLENVLVSTDGEVRYPVVATPEQAPRRKPGAATCTPKVWERLRCGKPVTVLAWGDSVTAGLFLRDADRWQEVFVRRLRKRFPKSEITLVSNGWRGRTSQAFLAEPIGSVHNFTNTVLNVKADLVISEFVNDCGLSAATLSVIYSRILHDFRTVGKEWVIMTPHYVRPDWMGLQSSRDSDDDTRPYVKFIREFAADNKVGLADASLRWGHLWREGIPYETMFVNDINHPNELGMSFFADALIDFFKDSKEHQTVADP